jgi:hypothetical protein
MASQKASFSDPFAPVEVQPVSVAGETVPTRVAIRVRNDDGNFDVQGIVGRDYQMMPNRRVRDIGEDVMSRAPVDLGGFNPLKTLWNGKHYVDYFASRNPLVAVNGTASELKLHLGVMLWNSYDGTRKTGIEIYALNPFCTNQYHSRNRFGFFAWRHTPGETVGIDTEEAMNNLAVGAENIIRIAPVIQELKAKPLAIEDLREAKAHIDFSQSLWGDVIDKLGNEERTHFGLFQAMTDIASHGISGMRSVVVGTSITDHFLKTEGVREVFNHTTAEQVLATKA